MRLKNKNIVVTAAAQGIGRATAIAFANEGANVIATDINEEKLNEIKDNHSNIETYKLDSTNKLDVEKSSTKVKIRTDDFRNESSFSGRIDYRSRNCNLVS